MHERTPPPPDDDMPDVGRETVKLELASSARTASTNAPISCCCTLSTNATASWSCTLLTNVAASSSCTLFTNATASLSAVVSAERPVAVGEAAVGRTAWSLSSFASLACSSPGAATATPATSATTQSGTTISSVRLRIGCVPFLLVMPRRARRGGMGTGERAAAPGGLHRWRARAGKLVARSPELRKREQLGTATALKRRLRNYTVKASCEQGPRAPRRRHCGRSRP